MANASESTEKIDRVLIARSETMAIDAADVRDARVAGANDVKAAQALNTDAHNGSAGGDQLESIQLIALDDSGKQKVVAERPKVHRQEPRITTEELRAKEKAGDIWAKSLVEDLDNAEKLPQPYRDGQIAEVLKKAQIIYRPEQRGNAEQPTEDQMDTGTMLAAEATKNPAAEPVKLFKEWVEKQAEGQQREAFRQEVRQEAASLSPEMKARMEYLAEMRRKIDAAGLDEGGVNQAITQEQAKLKLRGRVEQNTQESWLEAGRRIAELPAEQQLEVIGAGLMAGHEQYRADERERAWGQILGTTQGLGVIAVNLATIAEFTCDVVAGNKARSEERGGNFGKALGETLVSGVQLFSAADQYLFNVGCTGEYGKPFKDLADFGGALNERWSQIPPREQEHIKYKLITEMAADGLIGAGGAKALAKAKTFTEVMDAVAVEATAAGSGTVNAVNGVGRQVATDLKGMSEDAAAAGQHVIGYVDNVVGDLTAPEMALPGGGKIKFPLDLGRPADKPIMHVLMSKAEDVSGSGKLVNKGVDAAGKILRFSEESGIEVGELRLGPDQVWEQAPFPRGNDVHVVLGENLPAGTKTIDRVVFRDGIVEGQKSIDLTTESYADPKKLESRLRGYVHDLELYKGQKKPRMDFQMQQHEIEQKILHIGIRDGSISAQQKSVFEKIGGQLKRYNTNLPIGKAPIKLKVTVVK